MKSVKSIAKFIKNHSGYSAHIDEVELKALAELMDYPIEHVIEGINMFVFPDFEETNESCMCLGGLKSCYEPKD